jgi:hypothetical protein
MHRNVLLSTGTWLLTLAAGCGGTFGTREELGSSSLRSGVPVTLTLSEPRSTEMSVAVCFDGESLSRVGLDPMEDLHETARAFRPEVDFVLEDGTELEGDMRVGTGLGFCLEHWQHGCGWLGCGTRVRAVRIRSNIDVRIDRILFVTRTPA